MRGVASVSCVLRLRSVVLKLPIEANEASRTWEGNASNNKATPPSEAAL